jgi:ribosomal protein L14E/L6E/L27E
VNDLNEDIHIGRVVYSKCGRDSKKYFVVTQTINEEYVYIADGNLRTIQKPKKKKIKHLILSAYVSDEIKNLVLSGEKISNSQIKKFLQSADNNKEV